MQKNCHRSKQIHYPELIRGEYEFNINRYLILLVANRTKVPICEFDPSSLNTGKQIAAAPHRSSVNTPSLRLSEYP